MPVEIVVPQLGESVVEATISRWLKKDGDVVAAGETVAELETDKVNVEVTVEQGGPLSVSRQEGETVNVGEVIGFLGEANGAAPVKPTPAVASPAPAPVAEKAHATPVAAKIAEENKIDLSKVPGSGASGKVTKEDVTAYLDKAAPAAPVAAPVVTPAVAAPPIATTATASPTLSIASSDDRREERVKMSRRRQTIATRLVDAQHTAAMLTTFNEVDMTAVMEIRKKRKDSFKERHGVGLGFMSFFTKASVGALKAFPLINAEIQGDEIVMKRYYDIGVAVSTPEGLVVPVVRNADKLSFAGIEKSIVDLATRARDGKLTLPELMGGTFTITNGGIFGSLMSTPILNAPQVAILGMHKIQERPMVVNGEIVIRPMMYLALSYDHRIVDGREAVSFLVRVKELLEDPESLLLEG